ncbi:MAG TPA: TRAP transporter large permease subunit [Casimicrobiaceae bacterium]|nr:TRAP transporter large permease subunit [Casimicrobiaceae bacterium]
MNGSEGLWMLATVAIVLVATGLPAWVVLIGVALAFAAGGVAAGALDASLLTAMPARILGLLEHDLLQALPLYVLMGVLLDHLPLARTLFRAGSRALAPIGANAALAGLGLGVLMAPMNGSVGASAAMLSRTVQPRLDQSGMAPAKSAALVCVASTMGVVIPPSLVLILLGDAMMRAHTEAVNITGAAIRIINTQDVFVGALVPAGILLFLCAAITWWNGRRRTPAPTAAVHARDWLVAGVTALLIASLLAGVTLGYLYAVEAAAAGGVALFVYGLATRSLTLEALRALLHDTMAVTGALFALLVAATMFTLIVRGFGTDRWVAAMLQQLPGGGIAAVFVVLPILALCALVLDAFELIFVVVPVVMPPLLTVVPDATWVAVLTLLILQASFLLPPFGYAVLMVRSRSPRPVPMKALTRALLPYLVAQLCVLALILAAPGLVWQRNPTALSPPAATEPASGDTSDSTAGPAFDPQLGDAAGKPAGN